MCETNNLGGDEKWIHFSYWVRSWIRSWQSCESQADNPYLATRIRSNVNDFRDKSYRLDWSQLGLFQPTTANIVNPGWGGGSRDMMQCYDFNLFCGNLHYSIVDIFTKIWSVLAGMWISPWYRELWDILV